MVHKISSSNVQYSRSFKICCTLRYTCIETRNSALQCPKCNNCIDISIDVERDRSPELGINRLWQTITDSSLRFHYHNKITWLLL